MTYNDNITITDPLSQEAADWFIKLREADVQESDFIAWQNWLSQSDAHKEAFQKAELCWSELDKTEHSPEAMGADETYPLQGQNRLRRIMPFAVSVAATLIIAFAVGLFYQNSISPSLEARTYQTARAEHRSINLEDGSSISIGARSIVNVKYSPLERQITLVRGEAVFDVTKDKERPFIVKTGNGTVTAIGTKFNIHSGDENVTVTVLEGIVEVNPFLSDNKPNGKTLPRVSAGKAVSYHNNGTVTDVIETNVEAATSWEKGLLVRVDCSLADVIADVNRYSSREIIIGDPSLNNIRFTGTVLNDEIEDWLRGLAVAYPIKVLDSGHNAILLLKKEK